MLLQQHPLTVIYSTRSGELSSPAVRCKNSDPFCHITAEYRFFVRYCRDSALITNYSNETKKRRRTSNVRRRPLWNPDTTDSEFRAS